MAKENNDPLLGLPIKGASQEVQDQVLEKLHQGVESVMTEEGFVSWLQTKSRFWKYSPNNTILMMMQDPHATRVASYATWKSLERQVQKGERGMKIFYPMFSKVLLPPEPPETEPQVAQKLIAFGIGNVFDIRQTQGKPLPEGPAVPILDSDASGELFQKLNLVAHREGVTVRAIKQDPLNPELMGYYEPATDSIAIRDDVPQLQQTKTLAHEESHWLDKSNLLNQERWQSELHAEGSAFVTLGRYGYDSGQRSFPYLAYYLTDVDQLRKGLSHIHRLSSALINKVDAVSLTQQFSTPAAGIYAAERNQTI